jgi:predicted  nucleic acid-binding Zn-ribbon protein
MSPIGRIFIVLNLILAVAFLGWASTALASSQQFKTDYESEIVRHETTKTQLGDEISQMRLRAEKAENDLSSTQGELGITQATLGELKSSHAETASNFGDLKANFDSLEALMTGKDDLNGKLSDANTELNSTLMAANNANSDLTDARDALQDEKDGLERDIKVAEDAIAALEKDVQALKDDVQDRDTLIATAEAIFGEKMSNLMSMPHISGAVLMVSNELAPGLVSINRGSADSVQRGFTFDIYSGGQYKGRVRVVDVQNNQCFAVIEKTYEGRSITQGDSASTHI